MKLKFKIKQQDNSISHSNVVDSMEAGDAWVAQNAAAFGRGDLSLRIEELSEYGLTQEQASSTSEETIGGEVVTLYHFPKTWSVEVEDITQAEELEKKVQDRTIARQKCLRIIDEIAQVNEDANDPALMQTLMQPQFTAIILMLLTGGVKTARALMAQHGPAAYPQQTVDGFVAKMDAIIAETSGQ